MCNACISVVCRTCTFQCILMKMIRNQKIYYRSGMMCVKNTKICINSIGLWQSEGLPVLKSVSSLGQLTSDFYPEVNIHKLKLARQPCKHTNAMCDCFCLQELQVIHGGDW